MSHEWEAVYWDLGGVILDLASVVEGRETFVEHLAVEHDVDAARAHEVWQSELGAYFRERDGQDFRPARRGYQRAVERILGREVACDEWLPLMVRSVDASFRPVEGAVETVRAVAESDAHVGLISDIDAWEAEYILRKFDLYPHFDALTTSEEVGWTKPHPAMFETAIRKAGIDPENALHVGDEYEHDMEGATGVGLWTAAFGGTAAAEATTTADGAVDDPAVDYLLEELVDLLGVLGIE